MSKPFSFIYIGHTFDKTQAGIGNAAFYDRLRDT